jgi:hypothetical protein
VHFDYLLRCGHCNFIHLSQQHARTAVHLKKVEIAPHNVQLSNFSALFKNHSIFFCTLFFAQVRYHFGQSPVSLGQVSSGDGFKNFLVLSQIAAGLGIRGMAEQWRVQKQSAAAGATMGHLIWQLQDNWPGVSARACKARG